MIEYAIEDNIKSFLVIISVTNEHKTYESTVLHILSVASNLLGPLPRSIASNLPVCPAMNYNDMLTLYPPHL